MPGLHSNLHGIPMSLNIGLIGLPNVGKSTTFNALTKAQNAEVANYPFCTIEPNRAVVPVPDERIETLAHLAERDQVIHATIEFVDIAGLVAGSSRGEGLGNQFLGHVRNVDALLHVVRCFQDENVAHVSGQLDPEANIATINMELALADLEQLQRRIERLQSDVKGDPKLRSQLEVASSLREHIDAGRPIREFEGLGRPEFKALDQEMNFLSTKPVIYLANVDEAGLGGENKCAQIVQGVAASENAKAVSLCAELESELIDLTSDEQREMLAMAGIDQGGLDQVIRTSYETLGLISFFTMNEEEVRAWTVPQGTAAPQAAGRVHSDFERGFISAEVIPFETFAEHGSRAAVKAAGKMQVEGKGYTLQDGDLILFRFNI